MRRLDICIHLLLHYGNSPLIMALVRRIYAGKVRPSPMNGPFACN
ncbi:MAG: hypothetical protein ACOYYS_10125 [Chloroflexota bacterium]